MKALGQIETGWSFVLADVKGNIGFQMSGLVPQRREGGRLPGFCGFDQGPVTAIGNRATIHQGQLYRSASRMTSFLPSFRLVTDMGQKAVFTNLAGGPSDRRFSKWYCSDLENWIEGEYKRVSAEPDQEKVAF